VKKKFGKKYWYEYHLNKAKQAESAHEVSQREKRIAPYEKLVNELTQELKRAEQNTPFSSNLLSAFGFNSRYTETVINPIKKRLNEAKSSLFRALHDHNQRVNEAKERGAEKYLIARQERAEERIIQKEERHIRRLEHSTNIRSAQGPLKALLIEELSVDGYVTCYYCEKEVPDYEAHLEHKTPVSRGGTNKHSNLALACPECNFEKGSKTEKEFRRYKDL
jgi:5-methylcytosine-specific restriction endonuclease McrA